MTNSMNSVSLVDLRKSLGDIINRVSFAHERTSVSKHGKTVAVIVPVEDFELLEHLETQADIEALHEARQEDDGTRTTLEDFLSEETP